MIDYDFVCVTAKTVYLQWPPLPQIFVTEYFASTWMQLTAHRQLMGGIWWLSAPKWNSSTRSLLPASHPAPALTFTLLYHLHTHPTPMPMPTLQIIFTLIFFVFCESQEENGARKILPLSQSAHWQDSKVGFNIMWPRRRGHSLLHSLCQVVWSRGETPAGSSSWLSMGNTE